LAAVFKPARPQDDFHTVTNGVLLTNGTQYLAMTNMSLPPVGSDWHSLKLTFVTNHIDVDYDGTNMINMLDTEAQWHTNGGVCLDPWTQSGVYNIWVTNLVVTPEP